MEAMEPIFYRCLSDIDGIDYLSRLGLMESILDSWRTVGHIGYTITIETALVRVLCRVRACVVLAGHPRILLTCVYCVWARAARRTELHDTVFQQCQCCAPSGGATDGARKL